MPNVSSSTFLNQVQVPQTSNPAIATLGSSAPGSSPSGTSATNGSLGQNDFLKLLMAEMQNQDPSKPMDDTQTISQMAQFSALQATQQLQQTIQQSNNIQSLLQAGSMIGKYVQANQTDGSDVIGAVTGVDFTSTNGVMTPTLQVNGTDIDYSTIVKVSATPISATGTTPTTGTTTTGVTSTTGTAAAGTSTTGTSTTGTTPATGTAPATGTVATGTTTGVTPPTGSSATGTATAG